MQLARKFYASLTLKPQGATMIVAGFLPVFAIIAMFPVVAAIIQHFKDVPDAAIRVPAMVTAPGYAIAVLAPFAGLFVDRSAAVRYCWPAHSSTALSAHCRSSSKTLT
jgi:hypothetical protein